MAKLRHIAMQVPDLEKAARFYETAFGLDRVHQAESPIGNAIMLSDGIMNLTLLNFPDGKGGMLHGKHWAGLHHFGFVVDNVEEARKRVEECGGRYFMTLPAYPGVDAETKIKDPNGLVVDIAQHDWHQARSPR
jgi:catechol 2,3-dioxygenase-like lactoylglutathione lyase family enzyme